MPSPRPPLMVLVALAVAVLAVVANQAASIGWLVVLAGLLPELPSPTPGDQGPVVSPLSGVTGAFGGAAFGLALWGLLGWGLWNGQRWARAGATVLAVPAALYGLAPLAVLPLARRVLAGLPDPWDQVDLPGIASYPVALGVVGAVLFTTATAMLWAPAAGAWFRRDLPPRTPGLR